jgi:hypothetical protein
VTAAVGIRRILTGVLAFLLAVGASIAPLGAGDARAALPDLTLVTDARYDVVPEEARVQVTLQIVATNRLKDTATRRYYFDRAFLAVLPGTTGFRVTGSAGTPTVKVSERKADYTILQVNFGQRIYSGKSAQLQLRFDLPDPGGAPDREIRVGTSLVSFPVWAFATSSTPGSTVTVVFPPGFNVDVEAGDLGEPTTDDEGRTLFRTGVLEAPLDFFAFVVADRTAGYTETSIAPAVGDRTAPLLLRAWPDDPDWAGRVGGLFERGLPALHDLIGLPWPRDDTLVVQQTAARSTGGYAGLFDPAEGKVEVAYYADSYVVLHEAAHGWFNGALLSDRWANEAFASWYALRAAEVLGEPASVDELTDELRAAAIPLNAWAAVGKEETPTEAYGYAASVELARLIVDRAGDDGIRRVWQAAAEAEGAYQPPTGGPVERAGGPPDWRGLLDLLEEHTPATYDDLWRAWVVRDGEASLLDERQAAREAYRQVLELAGDWRLPAFVRASLRAWNFDQAVGLLADADGVLRQRDALTGAARAAGLTLSPALRTTFEGSSGFEAAAARAEAELATVEAVVAARESRIGEPGPVEALGLLGTEPDATLAEAGAAFAEGDLVAAVTAAATARDIWLTAGDVGMKRLLTIVGLTAVTLLVLLLAFSAWRGWLARRRTSLAAAPQGGVAGTETASAEVSSAGPVGSAQETAEPTTDDPAPRRTE